MQHFTIKLFSLEIQGNILYFSGNSYVTLPQSVSDSNSTLLQLSFLTHSSNSLLAYTKESSNYLSLIILDGILTLYVHQESTTIVLNAQYHPVFDQRWHIVSIYQNNLKLTLEVDEYQNSTQLIDMSLNLQSQTHIGGHPNIQSLPIPVLGYKGLLNVTGVVGGQYVHIIDDAVDGTNISESTVGICGPDTCSNGGLCQETELSFTCYCPLGFGGIRCEEGKYYKIKKIFLIVRFCVRFGCQSSTVH